MSTSDLQAALARRREGKRIQAVPMNDRQREGIKKLKEMMVISRSLMPKPDIINMSDAQFGEHLEKTQAERIRVWGEYQDKIDKTEQILRAKLRHEEAPLMKMQQDEGIRRRKIVAEYFQKNPLNKKLFKSDIAKYSSIYVCSFAYAKLEGSKYKEFIKSLTGSYKVHLGSNDPMMSNIVGLVSSEEKFIYGKPGDCWMTKERRPGLHAIGSMLHQYDDAGVILTDKTKEEVLRKFKECEECDFVKAGQLPMESVVFQKDDCVALPPLSEPKSLSENLRNLGMPVKLSEDGKRVCVTNTFPVCEVGKRVTEDAAEILKLLDKKMFKYVLVPLGCWNASTGKTESFEIDLPDCW